MVLPGDGLFDVVAALLVVIEEDVDLVHAAEEVVHVAHDVLVGAGQEDAEVVRLPFERRAAAACRARRVRSMNFETLPSESHVMSTSVLSERGPLVQAMDRHDREERAERPVIEQRLEHREVADVLVGELVLEVRDVVGGSSGSRLQLRDSLLHALGDLPEERLDAAFTSRSRIAELEHLLRLLLDLQEVVPALAEVCGRECSWM
jgi:hypothetical protein